jgi:hypothetical protein
MTPAEKQQKGLEKSKVIHLNCYKLFLCNLELKYIFEQADQEEIKTYNSSDFLISYMENANISFCILSSILISDKEEFSITKFLNDFVEDGERKTEIRNIISNREFQNAWQRIKTLRDKCYAHNDKGESEFRKEIQLTQEERNIITDGLIESLGLVYGEIKGGYLGTFKQGHSAGIKGQLKMMQEWRSYYIKDVNESMNSYKNIKK